VTSFSRPLKALAALERNPALHIAKADVVAWMRSDALQVVAEVDALIDQPPRHHHVATHA
jgi:hypothetical protein